MSASSRASGFWSNVDMPAIMPVGVGDAIHPAADLPMIDRTPHATERSTARSAGWIIATAMGALAGQAAAAAVDTDHLARDEAAVRPEQQGPDAGQVLGL